MPRPPKDLASKYWPNLGDLFEVGLSGVGVSITDTTLGVTTGTMTDATLVALPPNTGGLAASGGPIVHSLGVPPTVALLFPKGSTNVAAASFTYVTANNSAVYWRPSVHTGGALLGIQVRQVAIR